MSEKEIKTFSGFANLIPSIVEENSIGISGISKNNQIFKFYKIDFGKEQDYSERPANIVLKKGESEFIYPIDEVEYEKGVKNYVVNQVNTIDFQQNTYDGVINFPNLGPINFKVELYNVANN